MAPALVLVGDHAERRAQADGGVVLGERALVLPELAPQDAEVAGNRLGARPRRGRGGATASSSATAFPIMSGGARSAPCSSPRRIHREAREPVQLGIVRRLGEQHVEVLLRRLRAHRPHVVGLAPVIGRAIELDHVEQQPINQLPSLLVGGRGGGRHGARHRRQQAGDEQRKRDAHRFV